MNRPLWTFISLRMTYFFEILVSTEIVCGCSVNSATQCLRRGVYGAATSVLRLLWNVRLSNRGWFNTGPCCHALSNPIQHVSRTIRSTCPLHVTLRSKCESLPLFSPCDVNPGSSWQTGILNWCEALSHQEKNQFASKNCQFFLVSKHFLSHVLQWLLLAAAYSGWN